MICPDQLNNVKINVLYTYLILKTNYLTFVVLFSLKTVFRSCYLHSKSFREILFPSTISVLYSSAVLKTRVNTFEIVLNLKTFLRLSNYIQVLLQTLFTSLNLIYQFFNYFHTSSRTGIVLHLAKSTFRVLKTSNNVWIWDHGRMIQVRIMDIKIPTSIALMQILEEMRYRLIFRIRV